MKNELKIAKLTLTIILVLFFTLAVISIISEYTVNTNDTTVGEFTFIGLIKIASWPILIIAILILSLVLYNKKYKYGAILETLTGGILLANALRNIISYGANFLAVVLTMLLPLILIIQGILIIIKKDDNFKEVKNNEKKQKLEKEVKKEKTVKSRKELRK